MNENATDNPPSTERRVCPEVLGLLRCPVTLTDLTWADASLLANIDEPDALVNADRSLAFPIRDGIPALVPSAAIQLEPQQQDSHRDHL